MKRCFLKKRRALLFATAILVVCLMALSLIQELFQSSDESFKILNAYEDLLQKANSLRVPVVVIDTKILELVNSLSGTNGLKKENESFKEGGNEESQNDEDDSLAGKTTEKVWQSQKEEFENTLVKLELNVVAIATCDVFFRNKERILNELSSKFSFQLLPSNSSVGRTLHQKIPNPTYTGSHHFILVHKRLKVLFHLVVLRSLGGGHYIVDLLSKPAVQEQPLHYGTTHLAIFESKVLETQLRTISGTPLRLPKDIPHFLRAKSESRFIECNETIMEEFKRINSVKLADKSFRKKMNDAYFAEAVVDLLERVASVFHVLQVPFWLSSGTCLGWFRQCGALAYSKDVDVGVFVKDYHPSIISHLQSYGLSLTHSLGKVNDSYELSFSNGYLKLDIFFFYQEANKTGGDFVWNGGTDVFTGKKYKYLFRKFNLCWTHLFGQLLVRVPCETEQYLEDNYGPKWLEVVEEWDWRKSPSNVHENGVWSSDDMQCCVKVYAP